MDQILLEAAHSWHSCILSTPLQQIPGHREGERLLYAEPGKYCLGVCEARVLSVYSPFRSQLAPWFLFAGWDSGTSGLCRRPLLRVPDIQKEGGPFLNWLVRLSHAIVRKAMDVAGQFVFKVYVHLVCPDAGPRLRWAGRAMRI